MNPPQHDIVAFLMVMVLTLIIFGFIGFKYYLRHKENLSKMQPAIDTKELETKLTDQEENIRTLKERVEALEAIVTREEYELNRKFKAL